MVFYAGFGEWRWQKKMDSFYRRFVRNFVGIAAPLHALFALSSPKKNKGKASLCLRACLANTGALHVKWHSRLKQKFVSAPGLAYADFSRPFTLEIATRGWDPSCLRMFTDRGGQLHMKAGRSVEQRGIWKIVVP